MSEIFSKNIDVGSIISDQRVWFSTTEGPLLDAFYQNIANQS